MLLSVVNHHWIPVLIFALCSGFLLQNHFCEASGTGKKHRLKNILFLSAEEVAVNPVFPSAIFFHKVNGTGLCFNVQGNQSNANCCSSEYFSCSSKIDQLSNSTYRVTVNEGTLLKHDIVVLLKPMSNFSCNLSDLHNSTEFIRNLHNWLKPGGRNIRLSLDNPCSNINNDLQTCQGKINYMFEFGSKMTTCVKRVSCEPLDQLGNQNRVCKASGMRGKRRLKNILFISTKENARNPFPPSAVVFKQLYETRLCFNTKANQAYADCCSSDYFSCSTKIDPLINSTYRLTVNEGTLRKHDIVVILKPMSNFSCNMSDLHNSTETILNVHKCLNPGGRNIRMSLDYPCSKLCNESQSHQDPIEYTFEFGLKITSCVKTIPCEASDLAGNKHRNLTFQHLSNEMSLNKSINIMNNFSSYLDKMGDSETAFIKIGEITGAITKLQQDQDQTTLNISFTSNGEVQFLTENNDVEMDIVLSITISKKDDNITSERKDKYIGVLLFPGMPKQFESNSSFLNNKVLGIEIGPTNHSGKIDILYNNVDMSEKSVFCVSSDSKGQNWTTDHCDTNATAGNVTCRCSLHAFIAVVMMPSKPEMTFEKNESRPLDAEEILNIMEMADNYTKQMGGAQTAAIRIGNVTGVVAKLPENSADMNFGFGAGGDVMLFGEFQKKNGGPARQINLPKEAIEMAKKQRETHIRILIFPGIIGKNGSNDSLFSDEVLGIKMERNISNLSQRIKIQYKDATLMQTEQKYNCVSWTIENREDTNPKWTMNGCKTTLEDNGAKCECSHLTFFAILINKKLEVKRATLTFRAPDRPLTSEEAANLMKNLSSIVDMMGNAQVATIEMGNISGVIQRLPQQNKTTINIGFDASGKVEEKDDVVTGSMQTIRLSKEASEMAVKKNGSYAGVLRFPDIEKLNKTSLFLNNVILGIDMGVNISNLSETIDIHFRDVNTAEANATCVSWDGTSKEGGKEKWITDGCLMKESNGNITCQCSHLTFFAILMSSGENISPSHLEALTQITKAGCGMSIFFLGVAIFMHFLIRKTKATQAVQILMNLFIALFFLNLCFLLNETIANLENFAACVVMAAFMHYSMLATFTWFFMQALHLYFNLHKIPTDVKYYFCKICCTGWVLPAVMVLGLVASNKYDHVTISGNNDTSVNMCWIPDSTIHLGVNIGYYSIVFIFTLTIFIVTIVHIKHYASKEKKTQESSKTRIFSLLGLFCLLGITWGFAFFSYGPMLLPSYYIFTILNSFQGFFLFVYYYFSSKILPEDQKQSQSSSQSSQTVYTSPYG